MPVISARFGARSWSANQSLHFGIDIPSVHQTIYIEAIDKRHDESGKATDPASRDYEQAKRDSFKFYKERGYPLSFHDLTEKFKP